jgi:PDZ domain-containing protein
MLMPSLLTAAAIAMPVGFVVRSPGPTWDTLGDIEGIPLVTIDAPTYPASGQLRLTTVRVGGGPGTAVFPMNVLGAWWSPARSVWPVEGQFPVNLTQEEHREQSQILMTNSQHDATAAALVELGIEVPVTVLISGVVEGSYARGLVHTDDVIVSLDGVNVETHGALLEQLGEVTPGSDVTLGILRGGQPMELVFATGEAELPGGGSRAALGLWVRSEFDIPVTVEIRLDDIGGPSAGMMFALAIIDLMTPEDELGGAIVAGTGTINVDGEVGVVGGVEQKIFGAYDAGAEWFFVPSGNCNATAQAPNGIRIVRVDTLAEARAAMEAIGAGHGESLPTCE